MAELTRLLAVTGTSDAELARTMNVSTRQLYRPAGCYTADRFATAMGLHPAEVWGAQWFAHSCQHPSRILEPVS
jgi:hypothetical protein